ncbi:MAG TPA: protein kinase [Acidobacteriaceae bacterium]
MDSSKPATQIGKYEVISELGRGGMGVVYRAEDKFIGREVAIKQLLDATPELRQRFLVEAKSGVLNHQNIVTVYDFGEHEGNPYIVMEFLRGESLESRLKGDPVALVQKLQIVREVCEGLAYAHSKGVVHRDIKPANVMVLTDGHIKIVDFGIARLESTSGHTQTGAVIGTFHYISPERLKGEPSDGRADVWACGIMLYQMLTGRMPFPGEDISALHKVVNEPFPPLSTYLQNYPPMLDTIMERALAKNPEDRYVAEEMASDLDSLGEQLRRSQVGEALIKVKDMLQQEQLASARPVLLDLQRLDPQNTEVRRLLREVQDRLSKQQKSEQVRQIVAQAEQAVSEKKFTEALRGYEQAQKLDPSNHGLTSKVTQLRELKERADKVEALKHQAREARHANDFSSAAQLIGQALTLDANNTDLRNEQARILQEQERIAKEGTRRQLKEAGKGALAGREFTSAIQNLREALAIDPTDTEAQAMFQEAMAKQEEDRRRKIIEQIVSEIQDQIFRNQLERALELIHRALERLPGEPVLLKLRSETQKKFDDETVQKLVEETSARAQELFQTDPQEALNVVQQALATRPGEERLLLLQEQVVTQLKKANIEGLRSQYLKQAQVALDKKDFDAAIGVLESALLDTGESPEIQSMVDFARGEKKAAEQRRIATDAIQQAQKHIGEGDLEGAIAILRRASQETRDGAVDQLLRQTQERFDEVGRRVEQVITRIQQLSETDPVQALQLLQQQPQAIQQHPQMRTLRTKLDAKGELERATREAIAKSNQQLQAGQLRDGLETLEAVKQAYGDSPQIANAINDYKARRVPVANRALTTAMTEARRLIVAQQYPQALEALRKSTSSVEFADTAISTDWKRIAEEATKAAGVKRGSTDNMPIVVQGSKVSPKLIISIAVVLVAVIGAAVLFLRPKPAMNMGALQLNATPFAEIVSIIPADGKAVHLPAGDHQTPMRIDVPEGQYAVTFKGADGTTQKADCKVVANSEGNVCTAEIVPLTDADIETIVSGGK